eukprot:7376874-Prymnesium_polylepis.1
MFAPQADAIVIEQVADKHVLGHPRLAPRSCLVLAAGHPCAQHNRRAVLFDGRLAVKGLDFKIGPVLSFERWRQVSSDHSQCGHLPLQ